MKRYFRRMTHYKKMVSYLQRDNSLKMKAAAGLIVTHF